MGCQTLWRLPYLEWIFLYLFTYFWTLVWDFVKLLGNRMILWGLAFKICLVGQEQHLCLGLNSPHYWGKVLSTLLSTPWLMRSFILADGNKHYSWPLTLFGLIIPDDFSPTLDSFLTHLYPSVLCWIWKTMLYNSPEFSLFAAFSSLVVCSAQPCILILPRHTVLKCREWAGSASVPSVCTTV